jgi:DNA-binding MarR family transcriptional regulator
VATKRVTSDRSDAAASHDAWELLSSFVFGGWVHERMHAACASIELSPGLAKALLSLEPGHARPMGDLAGLLGCDASYATSIVDGLEGKGLVERQILPADRRVRTVMLTRAGERARDRWTAALADPPPGFASLRASDARKLRDLLEQALPPNRSTT